MCVCVCVCVCVFHKDQVKKKMLLWSQANDTYLGNFWGGSHEIHMSTIPAHTI